MEIKISKGKKKMPLRICGHGRDGQGKSYFGKASLFVNVEGGIDDIDCESINCVNQPFDFIMEALRYIAGNHKDIKQDTITIDSIDWVERMVHKQICEERGVPSGSINDKKLAFGVGHQTAASKFREILNALDHIRNLGFNIYLISHSKVVSVEDPNLDPYDRWDLALQKNVRNYVREWCDIVAYIAMETFTKKQESDFGATKFKPTSTGRRLLYIGNDPSYESKTRIALPDKIDLDWNVFMSAIEESRAEGDTAKTKTKTKTEKSDGTNGIRL